MIDLKTQVTQPTKRPPRITLYGTSGIGKSTFGAAAPAPLFIDIEDGLDSIDVPRIRCVTLDEVIDVLRTLYKEKHQYKTIVVDSIDWLEKLIFKQVCLEHAVSSIEEIGYAKGYVYALNHWDTFLGALTSLRNNKGFNIILLAHNLVKRYDDPMTESYERHQLKLHQRASALVTEWSDCLFFADNKVYIDKEDVGFKKEIKRGRGAGERVIYTVEKPAFIAKNRYSLPEELPLSWDGVSELLPIKNGKKEKQK